MPKSGCELSECEDALGINLSRNRFAIADGATEAFAAQSWAQQLAARWVDSEAPLLSAEAFRSWALTQGQLLHETWSGVQLAWYAEEKARGGSFAAFAGVQLDLDRGEPSWQAIALGDTCLIHIRNEQILQALPLTKSDSFNATPWLVPSRAFLLDSACERLIFGSGAVEHGDFLLLLSDAVAAWIFMLSEKGELVSHFSSFLRGQDQELTALFAGERDAGRLRDDDVAIISIEIQHRGSVAIQV
jgi:hypothetical protein